MANQSPTTFKQDVDNRVNQNGTRAITGSIMNSILTNIRDSFLFKFIKPDTAGRNAIATADRSKGMLVFVESSDRIFWLSNDLSTWEQIQSESDVQALVDAGVDTFNSRIFSPVGTLANLKAINNTVEADWADKGLILVEDLGLYRLDRQSTATADDNNIIQPTTGVGRWLKTGLSLSESQYLTSLISSGFDASKSNRLYNQTTKSANYSIVSSDHTIFVNAVGGNISITLPDPTTLAGYIFNIKKIDSTANTVTILPNASEEVEFGVSIVLGIQGEVSNLQSNGTDWFLVQ